jgi:hypothetical protein
MTVVKKIAFIIPYFGRFNNYFPLFLESCAQNPDCDWLIFTDDDREFSYPSNVIVHYMSFTEMQTMVQGKFDFTIALERAYKLCDFKPAYGYIFEEYLAEYLAWGYCDTDLIFGRIRDFISEHDIEDYDKIGIFGHCTVFRNTEENNRMFQQPLNGRCRYREVYMDRRNHSFDEEFKDSINTIYESCGRHIRFTEYQANIYTKSSDFRLTSWNSSKKCYQNEKLKRDVFVWEKGVLSRYWVEQGQLQRREYLYIHMQARPMSIRLKDMNHQNTFKIIPNSFDSLEVEEITADNFAHIRVKHFNLHYFRLRSKNLWIKIKKKLGLAY